MTTQEEDVKAYLELDWSDITAIPQNDGPNPVCPINYSEDYSKASGLFRAIMAKQEHSERALALTAAIIAMNPAHYTAWAYRLETVYALDRDLKTELEYVDRVTAERPKNYQVWHHRQMVVERSGLTKGQKASTEVFLEEDPKNYHVWSYRQWLVKRFNLWDGELDYATGLISKDVRNNSAWNYRFFTVFASLDDTNPTEKTSKLDPQDPLVSSEIAFTKNCISLAPQNQSPWNYLRGIYNKVGRDIRDLEEFCLQFAPVFSDKGGIPSPSLNENSLDSPSDEDAWEDHVITSTHALDLLADIYALDNENRAKCIEALDLLKTKYDPIRANYWTFRKTSLECK